MSNKYVSTLAQAFKMTEEQSTEFLKENLQQNTLTGFCQMLGRHEGINGTTVTEINTTSQYKVYGEVKQRAFRLSSFLKKYPEGLYIIQVGTSIATVNNGSVVGDIISPKTIVRTAYKIG